MFIYRSVPAAVCAAICAVMLLLTSCGGSSSPANTATTDSAAQAEAANRANADYPTTGNPEADAKLAELEAAVNEMVALLDAVKTNKALNDMQESAAYQRVDSLMSQLADDIETLSSSLEKEARGTFQASAQQINNRLMVATANVNKRINQPAADDSDSDETASP